MLLVLFSRLALSLVARFGLFFDLSCVCDELWCIHQQLALAISEQPRLKLEPEFHPTL